jgi:hypothetical protein
VFQAAVAQARSSRRPLVGAHILAAAAEIEQGPLPRALKALGVDPQALATAR